MTAEAQEIIPTKIESQTCIVGSQCQGGMAPNWQNKATPPPLTPLFNQPGQWTPTRFTMIVDQLQPRLL